MSQCCLTGFSWNGKPTGKEGKLVKNDAYIVGSNKDVAILIIPDVFGWTLTNTRLLADHYAKEADATVYVLDTFDGEVIAPDALDSEESRSKVDLQGFIGRNSKANRQPEIFECAKALRSQYKRVGAIGFCYGGWACFRLGAKGNNLVDAISMAHPSLLEKDEISNVGVPVQIMAPETDPQFTPELKEFSNKTIPALGVDYDYQYFPGLVHGFAVKGDMNNPKQKAGLERAKNCAVAWFSQYLHLH